MSFSILNISALLFIPLIILPILIHLISQKKIDIVEYPSLKFIKIAYLKNRKKIKISELLLMIIRILIISLVIFAFARPLIFYPVNLSLNEQKNILMLIDNSYSTSYLVQNVKIFDKIKEKAIEIIDNNKEKAKFLIVTSDECRASNKLLNYDLATEKIKNLNITYTPFSILNFLKEIKQNKNIKEIDEIIIISDFIFLGKKEIESLEKDLNSKEIKELPRFSLINCSPDNINELKSNINLSIVSVNLNEEKIIPGRPVQLLCKVKNHSFLKTSSEVVILNNENKKLISVSFEIDGNSTCDIPITYTFSGIGEQCIKIVLKDDVVLYDNTFNLVVNTISPLYVLILYDTYNEAENNVYKYISAALNPVGNLSIKDGIIIQPTTLNVNNNPQIDLNYYNAVILCGIRTISDKYLDELKKYVKNGGGILILPPTEQYLKHFSKTFNELLPIDLSNVFTVSAPNEKSTFNFTMVNYNHEIFSLFKNKNFGDVESFKFYKIIPYELKGNVASNILILAYFERFIPALIEKSIGKGNVILFTAYMDPLNSNITNSVLFVPFLHQVIYYLNKHKIISSNPYVIGQVIRDYYNISDNITSISCILPNSLVEKRLELKNDLKGYYYEITDTNIPGFYTIFKKSLEQIVTKSFAINFNPNESELLSLDYEVIFNLFNKNGLLKQNINKNNIKESKIEITSFLLLLVLLLMVIESVILSFIKS